MKFKCPLYFDIRDLWPYSVEGVGLFGKLAIKPAYKLERYIYDQSDKLLITSLVFEEHLIEKGQSLSKIIYLPNGITSNQLEEFSRANNSQSDPIRVIYAGTIGFAQGIGTIVQAANRLKNNSNIRFIIIGTGVDLPEVENFVVENKLMNVELMGAMPKELVSSELLSSDIAVLHLKNSPVFETVIPSKLLEYMAAKLPIVAGVQGQAEKIINESKSGYTCLQEDDEKMANLILLLAKDIGLRKELGLNGYKYLLDNFRWEKNAIQLIDDLNSSSERK